MTQDKEFVNRRIREIYSCNPFMKLCGIEIEELKCGEAVLGLKIEADRHFNLNKSAHGGIIASLADTSLGVVGATIGKRVVTASLQVSYIRGIGAGERARAFSRVVSYDDKFMVIKVEVFNNEKLLAEVAATMVIISEFADIPSAW